MEKLLIALTLLASVSISAESDLDCYSKIVKPSCSSTSQDLLTGPVQNWVLCEGYLLGKNGDGEKEAVNQYRQKKFRPGNFSITNFFQIQGISKELKKSINTEVLELKRNLKKCSKK